MEWIQLIILSATFVTLFTWNRTESRNNCRLMDKKIEVHRTELIQMQREMQRETNALIEAIRKDVKDLHATICVIEDRNKREK